MDKMSDNRLDNLFREKLARHTEPAGDLWPSIEASLDRAAAAALRRTRIRRMIFSTAAAAAAVVLGFILFNPGPVPQERPLPLAETLAPAGQSPSARPQASSPAATVSGSVPGARTAPQTAAAAAERSGSPVRASEPGSGTPPVSGNPEIAENRRIPDNPETSDNSGASAADPGSDRKSAQQNGPTGSGDRSVLREDAHDRTAPETDRTPQSGSDRNAGRSAFTRFASDPGDAGLRSRNGKPVLALASNMTPGSNRIAKSGTVMHMLSSANLQHFDSGQVPEVERVSDVKYAMPLNVGVQVQMKVAPHVAVGIGLDYSFLQSRYDGLINKKFHRVRQQLHYIGIPVDVYAVFWEKNNFMLYANLGGSIDKGLRAEYTFSSYDGQSRAGSSISGVSYSAHAGLGAEYRFVPALGIYIEPAVVYYFNSSIPASIRTDQPFQAKAGVGFRFHF